MSFTVEHIYKGIPPKNQSLVVPSFMGGLTTKSFQWEPIVISLTDEVNSESASMITEELKKAEETGQPFVPFFIHSLGGEVYALMSIIEAMRRCKIPIYTFVSGYAASCAACIFTCGKRRFMSEHSRLLIHDVSVDFGSDASITSSNIKVEAKEMRSLNRIIFQIMAENVGHDKSFFIDLIKNTRNNDIYVDAKKAIEWKLATEIGFPVVTVNHVTSMDITLQNTFGNGGNSDVRQSNVSGKRKSLPEVKNQENNNSDEDDDDDEDDNNNDSGNDNNDNNGDDDNDENKDDEDEDNDQNEEDTKDARDVRNVQNTQDTKNLPYEKKENKVTKNSGTMEKPTKKTKKSDKKTSRTDKNSKDLEILEIPTVWVSTPSPKNKNKKTKISNSMEKSKPNGNANSDAEDSDD
jgi:ATP-dependent Clp protease protease subunit